MHRGATREDVDNVVGRVREMGFRPHVSEGDGTTIVGVIGPFTHDSLACLEYLPGVDRLVPVTKPFKLGSRDFRPKNTVVSVDGHAFGDTEIIVIAGPCAVESEEQLWET